MTGVEQINTVRQLHADGIPIREISRQVKLSRNTIRKIIRSDVTEFKYIRENPHEPVTGPVQELIKTWLKEDQSSKRKYRRTAQRMYDLLVAQPNGYQGCYGSIARCVRLLKRELKQNQQEVSIPLFYRPGEAYQFDWSDMCVYLRGKLTTVYVAAIELCHSRDFYARAYLCQKQELMLDAHRKAFEHFGGSCRRGIYDNLKSAVKGLLKGHHRNLQEKFIQFTSHYLIEPEFCNPAKGNEKGRVENLIKFIRNNFFVPIPSFVSMEELNDRLASFAISICRRKIHPESTTLTRYDVYLQEKELLTPLPRYGFACCRTAMAMVSTTSLVFFDNNRYSVPAEYVLRTVLVQGYAEEVVISYNGSEITRHPRSFEKKQVIYNPYHYLPVLAKKPASWRDGAPFQSWQLPEVFHQYRRLLKSKYPDDGDRYFARTLLLLRDKPLKAVTTAIQQAIENGILADSYVLSLLQVTDLPVPELILENIRQHLAQYRAQQKPLSDYDNIIRHTKYKKEIAQ